MWLLSAALAVCACLSASDASPAFVPQRVRGSFAGSDHGRMTAAALEAMPEWEWSLWEPEAAALAESYCHYPDMAYPLSPDSEAKRAALPYQYIANGRQFHYWMREAWGESGNLERSFEVPTLDNATFFMEGAEYFFKHISDALRRGEMPDAARFAGTFMHAVQDPTGPIHGLEAYWGMDWRAMESLIAGEERVGPATSAVQTLVTMAKPESCWIPGYAPRLLGTGPAEAAFVLYQRHVESVLDSRRLILPMIDHERNGRSAEAARLRAEMERNGARLSVDILHTAACLAFPEKAPQEQKDALATVQLADWYPVDSPGLLSQPYGFSPLAVGYSFSERRQRVPLRLRVSSASALRQCTSGLGTGTHESFRIAYLIPKGVYTSFSCLIGLHAELSTPESGARLAVRLNGRSCATEEFRGASSTAMVVEIDISEGGLLELVGAHLRRRDGAPTAHNHVVWGDMLLTRAPTPALRK
ncbi:hypothetical protein ACFL6X_04825 [Candidatus Latescibacterota bacterium]